MLFSSRHRQCCSCVVFEKKKKIKTTGSSRDLVKWPEYTRYTLTLVCWFVSISDRATPSSPIGISFPPTFDTAVRQQAVISSRALSLIIPFASPFVCLHFCSWLLLLLLLCSPWMRIVISIEFEFQRPRPSTWISVRFLQPTLIVSRRKTRSNLPRSSFLLLLLPLHGNQYIPSFSWQVFTYTVQLKGNNYLGQFFLPLFKIADLALQKTECGLMLDKKKRETS